MRMRVTRAALLAAAILMAPDLAHAKEMSSDWRKVATSADRGRLREWRVAWSTALAQANAGGHGAALRAEGRLFDLDHALTGQATPPPGDYRCRVLKLGRKDAAMPGFVAYPAFTCRIDREGAASSFYKRGGSQRPVGLIFDGDAGRGVFLGTLMLGDETRAIDYGRDAARDMAGFVERIDERRWRIALPYPAFESVLDVIELVPAG